MSSDDDGRTWTWPRVLLDSALDDRAAKYKDLLRQIRKKEADQAAACARDEIEMKSAEYDLQAARVDMRKNDVDAQVK